MFTQKNISSISYNTQSFLKQELDTLINIGLITYYEYILHYPDEDDKKQHIHLFVMPAKRLNLESFGLYFLEKDDNNDKPLKCMPFRTSNYGDWYWYSIHDLDYLKSKQLHRNCIYSDNDIISSDLDFHRQLVIENPLVNFAKMSDMMLRNYVCDCVYNGITLKELLSSGLVPLGKTQSVILLYNALFTIVDNHEKKDVFSIQNANDIRNQRLVENILNSPVNEQLVFNDKDDLFD